MGNRIVLKYMPVLSLCVDVFNSHRRAHTRTHSDRRARTRLWIRTHTCTCTYMYTHARICSHAHARTHTNTHKWARKCVRKIDINHL